MIQLTEAEFKSLNELREQRARLTRRIRQAMEDVESRCDEYGLTGHSEVSRINRERWEAFEEVLEWIAELEEAVDD